MAQEKILGNQINLPDLAADLPTEVVNDTSPQLGGNLDTNGFNILTVDSAASATDNIVIKTGTANLGTGLAQSGNVDIRTGYGYNGNDSGYINILAGRCYAGGNGGYVNIKAGPAYGGGTGGYVHMYGGAGSGASDAGPVRIIGGDGGANSGYVFLGGGSTGSGYAGYIHLAGGSATAGGTAGHVLIEGGFNNTAGESGADVTLQGGSGNVAGGNILLTPGTGATEGVVQLGGSLDTYGHELTTSKGGMHITTDSVINITSAALGNVNISTGAGGDIKLMTLDRDYIIMETDRVDIWGDRVVVGSPGPDTFAAAEVRMHGAGDDGATPYTSFWHSPSLGVGNVDFYFPDNNGTNGDVLTKTGGYTSWVAPSGGGGNWITANDGNDFAIAPIATGDNSIAIGNQATAYGTKSIAIGDVAQAAEAVGSPPEGDSIAIGNQSIAGGTYSVCVGGFARTAQGSYSSTAIGNSAYAEYAYATSVGAYCKAYATQQTNVGYGVYGDATAKRSSFGYGAANAPGVGTGQNLVTIYGDGKVEPIGDEAMFIAPTYTVATLPPVTAAGVIYVSDAGGSPATPTLCFCDGTSWISVLTGVTVV